MYDPVTARFMQEVTYTGNTSDPLSLNRYTYCHNEPIRYWDPTGHWAQGDEKLTTEVQAQLIAITNAYYSVTTVEERSALHQQAEALRNDSNNIVKSKNTNNKVAKSINNVMSTKAKALSKNEWDNVINENGITYESKTIIGVKIIDGNVNLEENTDTITSFDEAKTANITVSTSVKGKSKLLKKSSVKATATIKVSKEFKELIGEDTEEPDGGNESTEGTSQDDDSEFWENYYNEWQDPTGGLIEAMERQYKVMQEYHQEIMADLQAKKNEDIELTKSILNMIPGDDKGVLISFQEFSYYYIGCKV